MMVDRRRGTAQVVRVSCLAAEHLSTHDDVDEDLEEEEEEDLF